MSGIEHIDERRASLRSRCLKGARIVLGNGNSTLACRIRNLSETGLKLAADETGLVPQTFALVADGSTNAKICQVSWRSRTELGATIVSEKPLRKQGFNHSASLMRMREMTPVDRYPV